MAKKTLPKKKTARTSTDPKTAKRTPSAPRIEGKKAAETADPAPDQITFTHRGFDYDLVATKKKTETAATVEAFRLLGCVNHTIAGVIDMMLEEWAEHGSFEPTHILDYLAILRDARGHVLQVGSVLRQVTS
jgi:hypothetical protein